VKRRAFLMTGLAVIFAAMWEATQLTKAMFRRGENAPIDREDLKRLLEFVPDDSFSDGLAQLYCQQLEVPCQAEVFETELFEALKRQPGKDIQEKFCALVDGDFNQDRIVQILGWTFSKAECDLFALSYARRLNRM